MEHIKIIHKVLRKHKTVVHGSVLTVITIGLIRDLHPFVDYGFLVLSILCEIPDKEKTS